MKTVLISILLSTTACDRAGLPENQSGEDLNFPAISIQDYLNFNEGQIKEYKCSFDNKITTEKLRTRSAQIGNYKCFYTYDEFDTPFYFINHNHFLGGLTTCRNDSIFFCEVEKEGDIVNVNPDQLQFLFPQFITLGQSYHSKNLYGYPVEYVFLEKTKLVLKKESYEDCILLTKTVYWKDTKEIDSIWLAKNIGPVKWAKSTGRIELLTKYTPGDSSSGKIESSGKSYTNSNGVILHESELLESHKIDGDFSTPTYNSENMLIREDFWGGNGEMQIHYITYEYDSNGNLAKEFYHYSDSFDPSKPPTKIWVNEYIYNSDGKLIESRHKFDINDEKYYEIKKYEGLVQNNVILLRYSRRHPIFKE